MYVLHHDQLEFCEDHNIPFWLHKLHHNLLDKGSIITYYEVEQEEESPSEPSKFIPNKNSLDDIQNESPSDKSGIQEDSLDSPLTPDHGNIHSKDLGSIHEDSNSEDEDVPLTTEGISPSKLQILFFPKKRTIPHLRILICR